MALQQMLLSSGAASIFSSVQLLLHGEGTNGGSVFTDSSLNNATLTRTGAVVTSTAQFRAGASSISVPGVSGYKLQTPNDARYRGAGGPWTLECSVYATAWTGTRVIYDGNSDGSNVTGPIMYVDSGLLSVYSGTQGVNYGATGTALTVSAWADLCFEWDGTNLRAYNGSSLLWTAAGFTNLWGASGCSLFANKTATPAQGLNGFADEFRFTKGLALYQGTRPAPSLPFPNS